VLNVVDADTIDARLDLGFGVTIERRFRIDSFDAAEIWRPSSEAEAQHGKDATERACELLLDRILIFTTSKTVGIYGRYGADITLPDGRNYSELMISEGFQKRDVYDDSGV
jgi:endonuclease YncB( thermonuclease family)